MDFRLLCKRAFVCSPLSSAINGAALRADGGVVRAVV